MYVWQHFPFVNFVYKQYQCSKLTFLVFFFLLILCSHPFVQYPIRFLLCASSSCQLQLLQSSLIPYMEQTLIHTYIHAQTKSLTFTIVCVCVSVCVHRTDISSIYKPFLSHLLKRKKQKKKIFRSPKRANNDNNSNNKISNRFYTYYEERNSCCATEHRAPRSMQERFDKFIARD